MSEDGNSNRPLRNAIALVSLLVIPILGGVSLVWRWAAITAGVLMVCSMLGWVQLSWGLVGMVLLMELALGMMLGMYAGIVALVRVRSGSKQ